MEHDLTACFNVDGGECEGRYEILEGGGRGIASAEGKIRPQPSTPPGKNHRGKWKRRAEGEHRIPATVDRWREAPRPDHRYCSRRRSRAPRPSRSRTSSTPMWASPRAPPPPSTRAEPGPPRRAFSGRCRSGTRTRFAHCSSLGWVMPSPGFGNPASVRRRATWTSGFAHVQLAGPGTGPDEVSRHGAVLAVHRRRRWLHHDSADVHAPDLTEVDMHLSGRWPPNFVLYQAHEELLEPIAVPSLQCLIVGLQALRPRRCP